MIRDLCIQLATVPLKPVGIAFTSINVLIRADGRQELEGHLPNNLRVPPDYNFSASLVTSPSEVLRYQDASIQEHNTRLMSYTHVQ